MNPVVDRMTPDVTTMIRMDHTHVFALFHRYRSDTPVGRKRAIVTNACLALQIHAQLEEEIFYPRLREVLPGDEVMGKSEPEHDEMKEIIRELRTRCSNGSQLDDSFDERFRDLMRIVIHHVADEETVLLPAAERLLTDELTAMGAQMTRRRIELIKPHAGEIAASTARSFPVGTATSAALLTAGAVALGAMFMSRGRNGQQRGQHRRSDLGQSNFRQ